MQTLDKTPPPLSDVSSRHGAPMGRSNSLPDDPSAPIALLLERLEWHDGDYDSGGAYFGGPGPGERPVWIWRATGHDSAGDAVEAFVRAACLESAKEKFLALLPGASFTVSTTVDREAFFVAYVECALFSSADGDGESFEMQNFDSDDIAPETAAAMRSDCNGFVDANAGDLALCGLSAAQAGHDFWLTRNRHGTGYWDRGGNDSEREALARLSGAARSEGSVDLYLGDGGKIYA
jgi:hypothetical protein